MLPNCLATDCSVALNWWLKNPLLCYHFAEKMKATELKAAQLDSLPEKKTLLFKLREKRAVLRATRALPTELIEETFAEQYDLFDRISDKAERSDVRAFSMRLADFERPWLRAQLESALDLRATLNHFAGESDPGAPIIY